VVLKASSAGKITLTTTSGSVTSGAAFTIGAGAPTKPSLLVAFGDSLTEGVGAAAGFDYPSQLGVAYGSSYAAVQNAGRQGNTSQDLLGRVASSVYPLYNAATYGLQYCLLGIGTNDIAQSVALATTTANITQLVAGLKNIGVFVGLRTIPYSAQVAVSKTKVDALNNWIRSNWQAIGADFLIDSGANPNLLNYYDQQIIGDGTHFTSLGYQFVARDTKRALDTHMATQGVSSTTYAWGVDAIPDPVLASFTFDDVAYIDLVGATAVGKRLNISTGGTAHSDRGLGVTASQFKGGIRVSPLDSTAIEKTGLSDRAATSASDAEIVAGLSFRTGTVTCTGTSIRFTNEYIPALPGDVFQMQVDAMPIVAGSTANGRYSFYKNNVLWIVWYGDLPAATLQIDTQCESAGSYDMQLLATNRVTMAPAAGAGGVLDNSDAMVSLVGAWSLDGGTGDYNGKLAIMQPGSKGFAGVSVMGTDIFLDFANHGLGTAAEVWIDGAYDVSFTSNTADSSLRQQYARSGMAYGLHHIQFVYRGVTGGVYAIVDRFRTSGTFQAYSGPGMPA
jgi:lysophospholipase L1-like esterase